MTSTKSFLWAFTALFLFTLFVSAPLGAAEKQNQPARTLSQKEIENIVRNYLREHPEVIVDAIRAYQERQAEERQAKIQQNLETLREKVVNDPTSPVGGNPNGNVTVVEFFDYHCGFCKRVFPSVQKLIKEDGNIRYVFKEFPILAPESEMAARAGLSVWETQPDKYFDFHAALMEAKGQLTKERVIKIANDTGVDVPKMEKSMDDPKHKRTIEETIEIAQALGIEGTPSFIIGNTVVPGAVSIDELKRLVEQVRKNNKS